MRALVIKHPGQGIRCIPIASSRTSPCFWKQKLRGGFHHLIRFLDFYHAQKSRFCGFITQPAAISRLTVLWIERCCLPAADPVVSIAMNFTRCGSSIYVEPTSREISVVVQSRQNPRSAPIHPAHLRHTAYRSQRSSEMRIRQRGYNGL